MISNRNLGFRTFLPLTNALRLDVPCLQGNGCVPLLQEIDCWLTCNALKGSWISATWDSWCGFNVQFHVKVESNSYCIRFMILKKLKQYQVSRFRGKSQVFLYWVDIKLQYVKWALHVHLSEDASMLIHLQHLPCIPRHPKGTLICKAARRPAT